ncbi:MAG TPA: dihydroorotase [Candidatus Pullichristensenella stercorigallinarum]|uniref:Dihydroorotase n=1 Tax=Candidatus Pullichristensenella stercorigallinarum TaxID=2840909 RepID=A0A9D0ZKK1_9FIRM|nr:dihydroorotase [Candidatus Pullichristensenella stercorigallinarum]
MGATLPRRKAQFPIPPLGRIFFCKKGGQGVTLVLKNAQLYAGGQFTRTDALLENGALVALESGIPVPSRAVVLEKPNIVIFPGLIDVHVHFREPGFSYKETMETGSLAAARGGFTRVCAMPNLSPVPDSLAHLDMQLARIREGARVRVSPYGAITRGEMGERLAGMEAMAPFVAGFSDDGRGVQSEEMMRAAMLEAKRLDKIIAAHCEDMALVNGGCIHAGDYARAHGLPGISSESEWRQVERDLRLAEETGCKYHVCHVSTKESVALIRAAKARGVDVSCETGPHYLVLDDSCLQDDGRFKMNPPLRAKEDREALLAGLLDGTVDMVATDHAPHSAEEKARGLRASLMGVVGLETAFPVLYTHLVRTGILPLAGLLERMQANPAARFGFDDKNDWAVFDLDSVYAIDPETFLSKGRATPFAGMEVHGECLMTIVGGKIAWKNASIAN